MAGPAFYVFTCEPQKERAAEAILRKRGYDPLIPTIKVPRRARGNRGEWVLSTAPAVPGYVFIPLCNSDAVSGVFRSRVIRSVLEVDGVPGSIQPEVMAEFVRTVAKAGESRSGCVGVRRGASVRVNAGAFAGHVAKVEDVRGRWAQIIVQLFGRPSPVRIATASLEVVDATSSKMAAQSRTPLQRRANRVKHMHRMTAADGRV